jgi:hypothetical protein
MDWSTYLVLDDRWMPHLFCWANVVVQSKLDQVADAKLAERIIDTASAVWLLPTESLTGRFWRKTAVSQNTCGDCLSRLLLGGTRF